MIEVKFDSYIKWMILSFHKCSPLKTSSKRLDQGTGIQHRETRIPLQKKKKMQTHPLLSFSWGAILTARPSEPKPLFVSSSRKNNSSHQTAHWPPVLPQICTHSSNQCIPLPFTGISSSRERRSTAQRSSKRDMSVGDFTMVQQANILPLRPLGQTQHQAEGLQEWRLLPSLRPHFQFVCVCILWTCLCTAASESSRY